MARQSYISSDLQADMGRELREQTTQFLQPAGNVDLRGFGGPREQEARSDHRGPVDQQGDNRVWMQAGDANHQRRVDRPQRSHEVDDARPSK